MKKVEGHHILAQSNREEMALRNGVLWLSNWTYESLECDSYLSKFVSFVDSNDHICFLGNKKEANTTFEIIQANKGFKGS